MLTFTYFVVLPHGDASGTISAMSRLDAQRLIRFRHPNASALEVFMDDELAPYVGIEDMRL